MTRLKND